MKKLFALMMVLLFIVSTVSCAPASPAPATAPTAAEAAQAPTEAPKAQAPADEVVTIRVMDQFSGEIANAGMNTLVDMFMKKYPKIKVQRDPVTSDNMRTTVQTSLSSNDSPDVIYYDTGPGFGGVLARAGLLMPLDNYYMQYKWDDRIFKWTKARSTYDGKVYGIGNELEFLGAYYNKDLFTKLGLSEPKTTDDLLKICQVAKDNNLYAIAFGDSEKWPAYHQFSMVTNNLIGVEGLNKILFSDGRWDSPEVIKGIQLFFADMTKAGCFLPDATAVNYADANTAFYSGKALIDLTGTWLISDMNENAKDFQVGWFFFPAIDGKKMYPPAGLGSGYFVSAKTKHPEEATQFLDYLFSDEAAKVWLESMNMIPPIKIDASKYNLTPLTRFAIQALQTQEMGFNIDVLTPDTFNTMMSDGFQAVMLGEKTAEQQAKDLQQVWEEAKAAGKTLK